MTNEQLERALRGALRHMITARIIAGWLYQPATRPKGELVSVEELWRFLDGISQPHSEWSDLADKLSERYSVRYPHLYPTPVPPPEEN